eukprot:UN02186
MIEDFAATAHLSISRSRIRSESSRPFSSIAEQQRKKRQQQQNKIFQAKQKQLQQQKRRQKKFRSPQIFVQQSTGSTPDVDVDHLGVNTKLGGGWPNRVNPNRTDTLSISRSLSTSVGVTKNREKQKDFLRVHKKVQPPQHR